MDAHLTVEEQIETYFIYKNAEMRVIMGKDVMDVVTIVYSIHLKKDVYLILRTDKDGEEKVLIADIIKYDCEEKDYLLAVLTQTFVVQPAFTVV